MKGKKNTNIKLLICHKSNNIENSQEITINNRYLTIGKSSSFSTVNGNLVFDVDYRDDSIILAFHPIPNERLLHGVIRVTDNDNINCYEDVEVYINQYSGLWFTDGGYVTKTIKCDCEFQDRFSTIYLPFIKDDWIETVQAFIYNSLISVNVPSNSNNVEVITNSCIELYDCPIYLCGYDKNGELLAQTVCYLTILQGEDDNVENCILNVYPTNIIIPNDEYQDGNILSFNVEAFSPVDTNLKVLNKEYRISKNKLFANTLNFELGTDITGFNINKTEDVTQVIDFNLNNLCSNSVSITLLKYIDNSLHLYITKFEDINLENVDRVSVFFNESGEKVDNPKNDLYVKYSDELKFTISSEPKNWYIYSYDETIFNCIKNNDNTLTIELIDYNERSGEEIIIANSDNKKLIITCGVDRGLVQEDEYIMYWSKGEQISNVLDVDNFYTQESYILNNGEVQYIELTSYFKEFLNKYEPKYGTWTINQSNNADYLIQQVEKISDDNIFYRLLSNTTPSIEVYDCTNEIDTCTPKSIRIFFINKNYNSDESRKKLKEILKIGDIIVRSNKVYLTQTKCYIDFIQTTQEASVRLNITHPAVTTYEIYTDQDGYLKK